MANNESSQPPPPPPEDDNSIDSPPPPKTSSSPPPPPPPSKDTPSPPVSRPPPPAETKTSPPPPSKSKDSPPPEANPPPDASPPPPSSPSKDKSPTSPPPPSSSSPPPPSPEKSTNPPPIDSNNPPPIASNNPPPRLPNPDKLPSSSPLVPPDSNDSPVSLPSIFGSSPPSKISPPAPLTSQTTNSSSSRSSNNHVVLIAGISVAGVLILALVIVCLLCCKRKKKRSYYYDKERQANEWNNPHSMDNVIKLPTPPGVMGTPVGNGGGTNQWGGTLIPPINYSSEYNQGSSGQHPHSLQPPSPMGGLGFSQCQFSYEDLATATSGFSQANLLGQGGFGYVHKGVLPDGKVVAVKSLKSGSGQGEREFQAEVEIISRVHHRHLVSLVGYCIADGQRMLVYEFVANQTMEHHLHGKGQPVMDLSSRVRIAIGSAKGLAYLHEDCHPRIIHRDIKAANILLDENYEAMVADFGLAKLTTENFTHVSTRVMGTFGYMAPEYASSGKLTEKSDVFSFGVMLLELITGRRPIDLTGQTMEDSLVDWARPLLTHALEVENYNELVDPRLEGNYAPHEMASMISCAAASTRHSAKRRPKMSQIVRALEGDSILVEETSEVPKAIQRNTNGSSSHDSAYDTIAYNADMMKFRNMVMNNEDVGTSSEYGATSEYGLNASSSSSSNNSREVGARTGQHKLKY